MPRAPAGAAGSPHARPEAGPVSAASRLERALLGPVRYEGLKALVRGRTDARPATPPEDHAVRARAKALLIEATRRQRAAEKELARLRRPELYRAALDVVAEITAEGELAADDPATVSVVITNFNYGRFLPLTLRSVFAQTHRSLEVVLVDDASTDDSPEMLGRLLVNGRPVPAQRVLLQHNVGLGTARNVGVRLARGRYVFILDADNHLLADCLRAHVERARTTGADAVYAMIRKFGDSTELLSAVPFSPARLVTRAYIDAMALFRRDALMEAGLYVMDFYGWEDYELWLRFAAQRRPVEFIPRVLSHYRAHGQSMLSITNLDTRSTRARLAHLYPDLFALTGAGRAREPDAAYPVPPGDDVAACGCGDAFVETAPGAP